MANWPNKKIARLLVFAICLLVSGAKANALPSSEDSTAAVDTNLHVRISLITCGPAANEVYEVFGHTAVRIFDSVHQTDFVYNYGTFDGFDADFEWKFMRGKLLYQLSVDNYRDFELEYVQLKRSVSEQVLLLTQRQKKDIIAYLTWNALPENSAYKYDFFFDNCATRIRDLFPYAINDFHYGNGLPAGRLTYRDIINKYFEPTPWERFGVNILLGSSIDKVMTNDDIMFLPDYLSKNIGNATANGVNVATPSVVLVPNGQLPFRKGQAPMLLTCSIALLVVITYSIPATKRVGRIIGSIILLLTGLLGCLILAMWWGTDHQACRNNLNLLWALPTNVLVAFTKPKGKPLYALIAMFLLLGSVLIHIIGVQGLLLPEMAPMLLSLAIIYFDIFRRRQSNK